MFRHLFERWYCSIILQAKPNRYRTKKKLLNSRLGFFLVRKTSKNMMAVVSKAKENLVNRSIRIT